jgi:hypothetical protein
MFGYFWLLRLWQRRTFGSSPDVRGSLNHLQKELSEIAISPVGEAYEECVDVVFLAWQIAWKTGCSPARFAWALWRKLFINVRREWPKPVDGEPTEHIRSEPRL